MLGLDTFRDGFWASAAFGGLYVGILLTISYTRWEDSYPDNPLEKYVEAACVMRPFFRGVSYWLLALTCAWFVARIFHIGWPEIAPARGSLRANLLPMLLVVLLYAALGKILRVLEAVYQAGREAVYEASCRSPESTSRSSYPAGMGGR